MAERLRGIISATSEGEAQRILTELLEKRLIAGGIISHGFYNHWWKGNIDKETYFNISIFTIPKHHHEIIDIVEKMSKDDTPGIVFFEIDYANAKFIDWIKENTK